MAKTNSKSPALKASVEVSEMSISKQDIPSVLKKLDESIKKLEGNSSAKVSTDIVFDNGGTSINIKDVKKVGVLLQVSSAIHNMEEAYNKEIKRYGLGDKNIAPYKVADKTVAEWEEIITKAINELLNAKELSQLKEAHARFSKYLSEEEKIKQDLMDTQSRLLTPIE